MQISLLMRDKVTNSFGVILKTILTQPIIFPHNLVRNNNFSNFILSIIIDPAANKQGFFNLYQKLNIFFLSL